MQKLIRFFILGIIPLLTIILFLLFINTVIMDWRYAHKSLATYQNAFNWPLYKLEINLFKLIRNFKNDNREGLQKVKLNISKKSQKKLLDDTPTSTKKWQNAFYLLNDNTYKKIKIRHRGDNPRNWLFEKKHWRIKTKKNEQFERHRYYNFLPYDLNKYVSGRIANQIGLISPNYDLIELFINEKSSGIYIQSEHINENFLRRNKLMPVNIYKGEQILTETVIGTTGDLFNSTSIWDKIAFFNRSSDQDNSDLEFFLNLINRSEFDDDAYTKLFEKIDLNQWSIFAAYQILTQNYHNDYGHNMRLIFDSWTGKIYPLLQDPVIGLKIFNTGKINPEISSHSLLRFLNRNNLFIHSKYEKLYRYLTKDSVIENQIKLLNEIENEIIISESRDVDIQRKFYKDVNKRSERKILSNKLKDHSLLLLKMFEAEPNSSWYMNNNKININVNNHLPISNIEIFYNKNLPKWISIDLNKNNKIEENEKFFTDKNGKVIIPITLYANRLLVSKNINNLINPEVLTSNTKFVFTSSNKILPKNIIITNPFTKEKFKLQKKKLIAMPASKFNLPILNTNNNDNFKKLSGIILVDKNMIIKDNVIIEPGTFFKLKKKVSIIFKNKVQALGTKESPIVFKSNNLNNNTKNIWGTVALHGAKTKGSILKNIIFDGGSGALLDQVHYTSMLSIHDTNDIKLFNIKMRNNHIYDDSLHIIYCNNILIDNLIIENASGDALDIDISKNIIIKNSEFNNSINDAIDIMESEVLIDSTQIKESGDKGISAGENSNLLIYNSNITKNNIGVAVKDKSIVKVIYSTFNENKFHINAYQKNLQYGDGGFIEIFKSSFNSDKNQFFSDKKSKIFIEDNSFNKIVNFKNKNIILSENNNFSGKKDTVEYLNNIVKHPLLSKISNINNKKLRGFSYISN